MGKDKKTTSLVDQPEAFRDGIKRGEMQYVKWLLIAAWQLPSEDDRHCIMKFLIDEAEIRLLGSSDWAGQQEEAEAILANLKMWAGIYGRPRPSQDENEQPTKTG